MGSDEQFKSGIAPDLIGQELASWRCALVECIPISGLLTRNTVAYKWKAAFRCWVLREASFWRITDLLTQSNELKQIGHLLGARILVRSGLETTASLIYLNHIIRRVILGDLDFHDFDRLTVKLVGGSKNRKDGPIAINVLTMLEKAEKHYPGLCRIYDSLSESAHPNFDGLVWGYAKVDHDQYETNFSNRWMELYGEPHSNLLELCMLVFRREYDEVWTDLMLKFEDWLVANDGKLEATRGA
jgi:hypothetical protein